MRLYSILLKIPFCFIVLFFSAQYVLGAEKRSSNRVVLKKYICFEKQVVRENTTYIVRNNFNLRGKTISLPKGCVLLFEGGLVYGGLLIGDKMLSEGIYTPEMFGSGKTKNDNNAIQSALNLCKNLRMDGNYTVYADTNNTGNACLNVPSDTHIEVNGRLEYKTSTLDSYVIFLVKNVSNVSIKGKGKLIGDKQFHIGKTGEFGFGVGLCQSNNVLVEGIECYDFWGDAIYLSYRTPVCENIRIKDVYLHDCRRQGISITGGKNIIVENFRIENILGTNPQSAIDIENHSASPIQNVRVNNGQIINCKQGVILQNKPPIDVINSKEYRTNGRLSNISITNVKSTATCLLTHNVIFDYCYSEISIAGPCHIGNSSIGIEEITNVEGLDGSCVVNNCDIYKLSNQAGSPKTEVTFTDCRFSFGESSGGHYYRNVNRSLLKFFNCQFSFGAPIEGFYTISNAEFYGCLIDCFDTPFLRSKIYESEIIVRLRGDDTSIFNNRGNTEIYNSHIRILSNKNIPLFYLGRGEGRGDIVIKETVVDDVLNNRIKVVDMTSGKKVIKDKGTLYHFKKEL